MRACKTMFIYTLLSHSYNHDSGSTQKVHEGYVGIISCSESKTVTQSNKSNKPKRAASSSDEMSEQVCGTVVQLLFGCSDQRF